MPFEELIGAPSRGVSVFAGVRGAARAPGGVKGPRPLAAGGSPRPPLFHFTEGYRYVPRRLARLLHEHRPPRGGALDLPAPQVGAVAVKDKRILATGYNGAPSKVAHCLDIGCLREQLGVPSGQRHEICRGLHAEQNVIIQAAVHGISLAGAEVYCTHQPCLICSKMLINCGITKIWYASGYPDELAMQMLNEADITLELLPLRPTPDGCGHTGPSGEGA